MATSFVNICKYLFSSSEIGQQWTFGSEFRPFGLLQPGTTRRQHSNGQHSWAPDKVERHMDHSTLPGKTFDRTLNDTTILTFCWRHFRSTVRHLELYLGWNRHVFKTHSLPDISRPSFTLSHQKILKHIGKYVHGISGFWKDKYTLYVGDN